VLNQVPDHEDVSTAELSTAPWKGIGKWRYYSTHSQPRH